MNKRIAIVTGSSTGIGKATVLHLSRKGFLVFAGIRRESDAEQFQSLKGIFPLLLDVSSQDSVEKAVEIAAEKLNTASEVHLINNAGIVVAGPVEGVSLTRWKEQFEVNFFGLLRVTQTLLPYIRKTRGRIVNISSISGLAAFPYLGPYCASKFAVEALSDALRRELRQFGCSVVVIEPGPINKIGRAHV